MRQRLNFDPFGEAGTVRLKDLHPRQAATGRSLAVERLGVGTFWALVVGIVATRIVYFDPVHGHAMAFAATIGHAIHAALG